MQTKNHVWGLDWACGAAVDKLDLVWYSWFIEKKGFVQDHGTGEVQSWEQSAGQEASHSAQDTYSRIKCQAQLGQGWVTDIAPDLSELTFWRGDRQANNYNPLCYVQQRSSHKMQRQHQ